MNARKKKVVAPASSRVATASARAPTSGGSGGISAPAGTAQINDVFVDDRGIVFAVDRHAGGLYALEMSL